LKKNRNHIEKELIKILKKRKKRFKSEIDDSDFPVHEKYAKLGKVKE